MGVFGVWCGKCAKYLAFGTFTTHAVDALSVVFVNNYTKYISQDAFNVLLNDAFISLYIFHKNKIKLCTHIKKTHRQQQ